MCQMTSGLLGRCLRHSFGTPSRPQAFLNFNEFANLCNEVFLSPMGCRLQMRARTWTVVSTCRSWFSLDPSYIASGRPPQKTQHPLFLLLIHCCTDVLSAPMHSNARGADHRKHRSSIVAHIRFRGNMFT
jgi:hypothetical protein